MRLLAPTLACALWLGLCLAGCSNKSEEAAPGMAPPPAPAAAPAPAPSPARAPQSFGLAGGAAPAAEPKEAADGETPLRRYLAVRHNLSIQTGANDVEATWKAANEACAAAGCEVLNSSISRDTDRLPANATLEARVPPAELPSFLAKLSALGTIGQHSTSSEDKTDEVIDTEARQKNTADFRDNLRRLLSTPNATLKDLIEVQRELARVQAELDGLATRRKHLSQLTDKVHVTVQISAKASVLEGSTWSPVRQALQRTGRVLAGSVAALIEISVALLPWALLLGIVFLVVRAWRRKRSAAQSAAAQPAQAGMGFEISEDGR